MKKQTIIQAAAVALLTFGTLSVTNINPAHAATETQSEAVINERWGKPTFVAGAGLNDAQLAETMTLLDVQSENVKMEQATGADLIKYLGYGSGDDSVMLSSVVVTQTDPGKGVDVQIVTPANITVITADQYKNPLITAGVTDATIKVASVTKVTGESALTGVYKAFAANGEVIDPQRAQLAQEELDATTAISQDILAKAKEENSSENLTSEEQAKADEAYKAQLNQTLVDIKLALAELKDKQNELATKEDIGKIVQDALEKNNLSAYISQENIQQLVALAEKYQDTSGVLDKESLAQLKKISEDFQNTVKVLSGQLGEFGKQLSDGLKGSQGFFSSLWQTITSFFTNLFK